MAKGVNHYRANHCVSLASISRCMQFGEIVAVGSDQQRNLAGQSPRYGVSQKRLGDCCAADRSGFTYALPNLFHLDN